MAQIILYLSDYWDTPSDPEYTLLKIQPIAVKHLRPNEDQPIAS